MTFGFAFYVLYLEVISIGLLLMLATHCFTTIRFRIHHHYNRRHQGREPATIPYSIPGLGSALSWIQRPHDFFDSIRCVNNIELRGGLLLTVLQRTS